MKEKKDVLFLCQFFYPEYISSATLPYDTAKALTKNGLSVGVLCGYPKEYSLLKKIPMRENNYGIEIIRVNYFQIKRSKFWSRLINYFSFTLSVLLKFISIREYKILIVYSNPPILPVVASLANMVFGTKIIFVSYDVYPEIAIKTKSIGEKSLISTTMNFINESLYKRVSKVVALSHDMKGFILENRKQIDINQIVVIPNWYEDRLEMDIERSYHNPLLKSIQTKEKLVISYFGNIGIAQDIDTIIGTIKYFKDDMDIIFVFAGHGNKFPYLKKIVYEENLNNVIIYDFLHGDDFQDALNLSDVFIVTLAKDVTGMAVPSKVYTYMMAGKPIIAIMDTNSDIAKEIKNNDAGFVAEVGEINKVIKNISELKNNKQLRTQMGINSRRIFEEKYTTEKATLKYVDLVKNVLEDKTNV